MLATKKQCSKLTHSVLKISMPYIKHFYVSPQQYQTRTKCLYLYTTTVGTLHTSVNSNVRLPFRFKHLWVS